MKYRPIVQTCEIYFVPTIIINNNNNSEPCLDVRFRLAFVNVAEIVHFGLSYARNKRLASAKGMHLICIPSKIDDERLMRKGKNKQTK
jgi:hypothetical protein